MPDRAFTAQVYRFVRDHVFFEEDIDLLSYRLGGDGSDAAKILLTIDVLKELGVFHADENGQLQVDNTQKVTLEASALLRQIRTLAE